MHDSLTNLSNRGENPLRQLAKSQKYKELHSKRQAQVKTTQLPIGYFELKYRPYETELLDLRKYHTKPESNHANYQLRLHPSFKLTGKSDQIENYITV